MHYYFELEKLNMYFILIVIELLAFYVLSLYLYKYYFTIYITSF